MELEQEFRKVEEIKYKSKSDPFTEYLSTFIQRLPRYAVKPIGKSNWRTKNKPLSDIPVKAHLNGQYYVGGLGKWYPEFAILDLDNVLKDIAEEIREKLGLDSLNSMLCSSESENSYHILIKPAYKKKPPTIRLLNNILKPFANENGIEVYPQANKAIRLPFGYKQDPLDIEYLHLGSWQQKLYWFNKLDYFDLEGIPYQQLQFDIDVKPEKRIKLSTYQEGRELYHNGLLEPSSRNDSQWKIIYYFWRQNIPLEIAIGLTWHWINRKHNGFSQQIVTSPQSVRKEIQRQAKRIYGNYELKQIYPDSTHNGHNGFITKADIEDIFYISKANLPKAKFLYNLVKYCYPRHSRTFIQLHSDNLKEWSQKGYMNHLEGLQRKGIVKRYGSYQVDKFSKSIKINWNFRDPGQAILIDERAPEEFRDTIKVCYEPEEFRELLMKAGSERTAAIKATRRLFEGVTKVYT